MLGALRLHHSPNTSDTYLGGYDRPPRSWPSPHWNCYRPVTLLGVLATGQATACLQQLIAQQDGPQFHRTHHRIHAWRHPPILRTLSFAREVGRKARQQNLALPISLRAVPHARGMRQRRASLAG
jgi:hypothetical protein